MLPQFGGALEKLNDEGLTDNSPALSSDPADPIGKLISDSHLKPIKEKSEGVCICILCE